MDIYEHRKAFSVRLNEALDDVKFTAKGRGRQQALANRMRVSQRGARKWLSGEALPENFRLLDMTEWLHVRFEWLATGHGPKWQVTGPDAAPLPAVGSDGGGNPEHLRRDAIPTDIREEALSTIRAVIDGQHRAFCITDDDAVLLHASLGAIRGKMEPSIRAALLLMLGSRGSRQE
jgi:hypothetical protein